MAQLMPLHPQTPPSLASFKSRLVLPFWYRLTQVVLEKRPLNWSSSSSIIVITITIIYLLNTQQKLRFHQVILNNGLHSRCGH